MYSSYLVSIHTWVNYMLYICEERQVVSTQKNRLFFQDGNKGFYIIIIVVVVVVVVIVVIHTIQFGSSHKLFTILIYLSLIVSIQSVCNLHFHVDAV